MTPLFLRSVTLDSGRPGPRLLILGAVHGNEVCGTRAIERVLCELEGGHFALERGSLTCVPIANPKAYAHQRREGDRNLNRNLAPTAEPKDNEDLLANALTVLLSSHDGLLDLHSFQSGTQPFVMVGPSNNSDKLEPFQLAEKEEAWAACLGVSRYVDGWLSTYAQGVKRRQARFKAMGDEKSALLASPDYGKGTTEAMRALGGMALTLECGQHDDPASPDVAYRAIRNSLVFWGLTSSGLDSPAPPQAAEGAQANRPESLSLFEVVDKQHPDDSFSREWKSFDEVAAGELIGTRASGEPVTASETLRIVFPNRLAKEGQEWFYLARSNRRFSA